MIWRNKLSVLMGDFLLSKALINMIGLRDFDALEMAEEFPSARTFPQIILKGEKIGGFTDLQAELKDGIE